MLNVGSRQWFSCHARLVATLATLLILAVGCQPADRSVQPTFQPPRFQSYESASWSPDGREIAFNWNDSGTGYVGVVSSAGGDARKVLGAGSDIGGAGAWAPGTGRILASPPLPGDRRLVATNLDGDFMTITEEAFEAAWSFGGNRIAYSGNDPTPQRSGPEREGNIFVMDADGTHGQRVSELPGWSPYWSPDSARIVFCSKSSLTYQDGQIYVANADGTGLQNLSNNQMHECDPVWSRDGNWIAFEQSDRPPGGRRYSTIMLMRPDGSARRQLLPDGWDARNPAFSPDGTKIAYTHYVPDQVATELRVVNVDGTGDYKVGGGERD